MTSSAPAIDLASALDALSAEVAGTHRAKFIPGLRDAMANAPDLFQTFERFALDAIVSGRGRFSANMIFNRMRWYTQVESPDGSGFKVNDHYSALLARLFVLVHPEHDGFFEFRERSVA